MCQINKISTLIKITIATLFLAACSEPAQQQDTSRASQAASEQQAVSDPEIEEGSYATLRNLQIAENKSAPRMMPVKNEDLRTVRNYPEQPPLIPHKIEGYQIDGRHNTCMTCHSRAAVGVSQAPMVSITHFMNREGQFLASVSPRRYFCNQCHVPQRNVSQQVENTFVDVDTVLGTSPAADQKVE